MRSVRTTTARHRDSRRSTPKSCPLPALAHRLNRTEGERRYTATPDSILAATFDLPDEGRWSYLIDPVTGRIDGMQVEGEHQSTISRWTTEWVDPVTGF